MRNWNERSDEIKTLLNPAFCGRVLYMAVDAYQKKTNQDFPFPLIYLILPLVLPGHIRAEISSRTQLLNWVHNHPELIYDFGARANDLIEITNESIEFMMQCGYIKLTDKGELSKEVTKAALSKTKYTDAEASECLMKAEHVGRWFASTGKTEQIYVCLGVRP